MYATTSRRPAQRQRFFRCTFEIEGVRYWVIPHRPHPEVAVKAFRLKKLSQLGDPLAVYDVRLAAHGPECDCLGWLRWQRPCKHIKTLVAMGMLS